MRMLYCRKCGAAMFAGEDLAQSLLDRANEAANRARRCPGRYKAALLHEAAAQKAEAEKEAQRIYGEFETACNKTKPDTTAEAAIAKVEKERRCGK